jgi:hypothetical protein
MICRRALPLPIALSLALTACQRPSDPSTSNPEFIRLEGERLSQAQREELLRMRYERLAGPYEETVSLSHELESERAVATTLRERKQELEQAVTTLNDQKENLYRSALRAAQERAIGTQMPELKVTDGRTFKQVTVTGASEAGIQIRHSTGTARLSVNDLGPERSERYGLDPEHQADALAREAAERQAYERWVDQTLSLQAKAPPAAKPTPRAASATKEFPPMTLAAPITRKASSASQAKGRYFGGLRSRSRYVYYSYYRPASTPLISQAKCPSEPISHPASSQ